MYFYYQKLKSIWSKYSNHIYCDFEYKSPTPQSLLARPPTRQSVMSCRLTYWLGHSETLLFVITQIYLLQGQRIPNRFNMILKTFAASSPTYTPVSRIFYRLSIHMSFSETDSFQESYRRLCRINHLGPNKYTFWFHNSRQRMELYTNIKMRYIQ